MPRGRGNNMGTFDPDKFLKKREEKTAGFDPDAWLGRNPSTPEEITSNLRLPEMASRGIFDSVGNTIAAIPEAISDVARLIPGGKHFVPREGYYKEKLDQAGEAVGGLINYPVNRLLGHVDSGGKSTETFGGDAPREGMEKVLYGAGKGAIDAASLLVPGLALAKAAKTGSLAANVGQSIIKQPVVQLASGSAGRVVAEETDSDLAGLGASFATGVTIPGMVGAAKRLARPVKDQASRQGVNVVAAAKREGIDLTAGQATESQVVRNVEAGLADLPLSSAPMGRIFGKQREQFNRAVLKKAGIESSDAGPDVINKAFTTIGNEFDDLASKTVVKIDKKFFDQIDEITRKYASKLDTNQSPLVSSMKNEFDGFRTDIDLKGPATMKGPDFQRVTSELKELARSQLDGSWPQKTLYKYASALDDALERSFVTRPNPSGTQVSVKGAKLPDRQVSTQVDRGEQSDLLKQWKSVRNRYRNLLQISRAVRGGDSASEVSGDIPLASFRTAVKSFDQMGYSKGKGDFNDLSRVAALLQSSVPPNSGTPQRLLMQRSLQGGPIVNAVKSPMVTATTGATAGAIAGGLPGAVIGGGIALTLPRGIQAALMSPAVQSYLKNVRKLPEKDRDKMISVLLSKIAAAQGVGSLPDPSEYQGAQ
tara:strand:+ start:746 stop:2698 length:1953 start_codon:yes stop_codon:yes gene_type:complete